MYLPALKTYKMYIKYVQTVRNQAYFLICLRSQTLTNPSSPPESRRGSFLFHDITLTSVLWAGQVIMQALLGAARTSHILTLPSTEHEANTCKHIRTTQSCNYDSPLLSKRCVIFVFDSTYTGFSRAPLDVFHRFCVGRVGPLVHVPAAIVCWLPNMDVAMAITSCQATRSRC